MAKHTVPKPGMQSGQTAARARSLAAALLLSVLLCTASRMQLSAADSGSGSSGSTESGSSSGGSGRSSAAQRTAKSKLCINNMMHRVLWTPTRTGGPNCNSACRSYGGGSNRPYMAINTGSGTRPYFLCRAPDPSFSNAMRAGCVATNKAKSTTCYTYAHGGPRSSGTEAVLHAYRMQCACVADTSRAGYTGCSKPAWLHNTGAGGRRQRDTTCKAFCAAKGRAAVEDHPGQGRYVCRPRPTKSLHTIRMGWTGYQKSSWQQGSGIACHFMSADATSNEDISVFSYDYECLCI